jgi:hypothetical protein
LAVRPCRYRSIDGIAVPVPGLIEAPSLADVRALAAVAGDSRCAVTGPHVLAGAASRPRTSCRPAMAYEKYAVVAWVQENFGPGWASEHVAFANRPISCYVATRPGRSWGSHATTARAAASSARSRADAARRTGRALLLSCLRAMAAAGYAYAIVGGVDSPESMRGPSAQSDPRVHARRLPRSTEEAGLVTQSGSRKRCRS